VPPAGMAAEVKPSTRPSASNDGNIP